MSYDLAVWRYPGHQVSPEQASARYVRLCDRPADSLAPGPEMTAFVGAVADRFGGTEGPPGTSPWAAPPDVDQDSAVMTFRSALAAQALPFVRELARDQGLVCFNPQSTLVYQPPVPGAPAPGAPEPVSLRVHGRREVVSPGGELIARGVRGLSREHWYAALERDDQHYLQAGYGPNAGVADGSYALEYRDGGPGEHWRAVTPDVAACVRAFLAYGAGEPGWAEGFSWTRTDV
jgi:hypothetical protein